MSSPPRRPDAIEHKVGSRSERREPPASSVRAAAPDHTGVAPRGHPEPSYPRGSFPASRNTFTSSSGSGKMMVEFFSAEISTSVCR